MSEQILIVDDEDIVREALGRILGLAGYQVDHAASGDEGITMLGQRPYDLLLVDLRMPGMDGLQFLEASRRLDPSCGALIMTGYGTLESAMAAMELGAQGFILKPMAAEELLKKVGAALSRVRSAREQHRLQALRPVYSLSQALLEGREPQAMAERLLDTMLRELGASQGLVFMKEGQEMRLVASRGFSQDAHPTEWEVDHILWSSVGRWEEPLLITEESHRPELYQGSRERGIGSLLGIPLAGSSGTLGFLALCRGLESPAFTRHDVDLASVLGGASAPALDASRLSAALREEARRGEDGWAAAREQVKEVRRLQRLVQAQEEQARSLERRLGLAWRTFAEVADLWAGWRQGHAARSVELVRALAEPEGLPEDPMVEAALLYDVGMARAPERVSLTQSGPSPPNGQSMRQHPADGAALLQQMGSPREVVLAALHHHENYDGSGYPDRLAGPAIPFLARVLRVVDSYLDLVHGSLGSEALSQDEALARMKEGTGSLFDPQMVQRLSSLLSGRG